MKWITSIDSFLAAGVLSITRERSELISLMFHDIFINKQEAKSGFVYPQQGTTLLSLRSCIEYFLNVGYRFVSPEEIYTGLDPHKYHILLTFDDGYYNNLRTLALLQEYDIPAVFFISSGYVKSGKAFWWDIAYRNSQVLGFAPTRFVSFCADMQSKRTWEIEDFLKRKLGADIMKPVGDLDRPMNVDELRTFSSDPHVHIGNHTHDHAILVNYTKQEIEEQITLCQQELKEITGKVPLAIAYPQGFFNELVIDIAKDQGLRLGVTCRPGKVKLPLTNHAMVINRDILWEDRDQRGQYMRFRSDLALYPFLFGLRRKYFN